MERIKFDYQNSNKVISKAKEVLENGGIVIYPTETCYGVGVDATNSDAVTKVLEYKKRPEGKAISIGVCSEGQSETFVELNETAKKLYKSFLPGPLTVISASKHNLDPRLESEKGTLGVRIPNYKLIIDLICSFGKPITTTSANSSGAKTPYTVEDILENLSQKQLDLIDLIIDVGELPHNPPSTVIDTTTEDLTTYRQGRIDPLKISESKVFQSNSVEETINIGKEIIPKYSQSTSTNPIVILLNGELGAGKTHLTKGIAQGLGITQLVKSPTYNYVNEYKFMFEVSSSKIVDVESKLKSKSSNDNPLSSNSKLYHMDAWRIHNLEDLELLRFEEWFKAGNVIVVEWPSVVMNLKGDFFEKMNYLYVDFINLDQDSREIRVYQIKN